MERLEKTPTPREQLSLLSNTLQALVEDDVQFYFELAHRMGEVHETYDTVASMLPQHKAFAQEIFTDIVPSEEIDDDEEDAEEEEQRIDTTQLLREQFGVLVNHMQNALESDNFAGLSAYVDQLQVKIHTDSLRAALGATVGDETPSADDVTDTLIPWLQTYLDDIKRLCTELAVAPDFDLKT
jgi:hypothetical protein